MTMCYSCFENCRSESLELLPAPGGSAAGQRGCCWGPSPALQGVRVVCYLLLSAGAPREGRSQIRGPEGPEAWVLGVSYPGNGFCRR